MIRGDERYWANMVLDVIDHVECPMLMYEGEKMIVRKALKAYLEDRKDEPQADCKDCKYVWWNSEAKRYECSIEKCPYSQTERSE